MSESITTRAARAIMNGRYIGGLQDVPVPFSRAELYCAYRGGFFLFHVPAGSLGSYPGHLHAVLEERDFLYERDAFRNEALTQAEFVLAPPRLHVGSGGCTLDEQKREVHSHSILSPYEIVTMYSLFHGMYPGKALFLGQARTEYEVGAFRTHLHTEPLTTILSSTVPGHIKLGKGYVTQISPELGVMTGERRLVV